MTKHSKKLMTLIAATLTGVASASHAGQVNDAEVAPKLASNAASAPQALFEVTGFRSAKFGMSPQQVVDAAEKDFKASKISAELMKDDAGAPRAAVVHLTALEPGPGVATVTYIFDEQKHQLMHVNVVWATGDTPTPAERAAIADGGVRLTTYFNRQGWAQGASTSAAAADASFAIMFAGVDPKKASVEVKAIGIKLERKDGVKTDGTGPAVLRVAYGAPPVQRPPVTSNR